MGVALLASSGCWLARLSFDLNSVVQPAPTAVALTLATIAVSAPLGFLLGFGTLERHVLWRSEALRLRGVRALLGLASIQTPLALAAVALGTATYCV